MNPYIPKSSIHKNKGLPATLALAGMILLGSFSPANAQLWDRLTNPTMDVPVTHPPQIVITGAKKVAVQEFAGDGGAELSDRFVQALMENGEFEVIDRNNLKTILREQGLQTNGAFSTDVALRLGQLSGCGAVFTGRITRASVEPSPLLDAGQVTQYINGQKTVQTKYIRKVTARITASIQLVDLTTGRTHTGKMVEATKVLQNEAIGGAPEPPSSEEALSGAYQEAISQMTRMIMPWTEIVQLVVYDNKQASLKQSADMIKVGDFAGAAQMMQSVIDTGLEGKETKYLPKVYYNYGIALMYSGNPQDAIPALQKSLQLRSTSIATEAIATAKKMIALQKEEERKENNAVNLNGSQPAAQTQGNYAPAPAQSQTPPPPPPAPKLTNADVIAMSKAGLGDQIIIAKIRKNPGGLDGSTDGMIALKKGGVSDAVIMVIGEIAPQ